jgi:iron(III) transport system substrate-binding protein
VRVERSGAERNFQRIGHEQGSRIYAVDVCTIAPAHFIHWIQNDWVAPFVPEGVARHFPSEHVDPNGMHAVLCAWLETAPQLQWRDPHDDVCARSRANNRIALAERV